MIRKKTEKVLEDVFYKLSVALERLDRENPKTNKGKLQKQKEIVLLYDIAKLAAKRIKRLKNERIYG